LVALPAKIIMTSRLHAARVPFVKLAREEQAALQAVRLAARLCVNVRAAMVRPDALEKSDRSPVTVADFGSQALVCRALGHAFPGDPIVGEEDAAALRRDDGAALRRQVRDHVAALVPGADEESVCDWIDAGNGSVGARYWTLDPIDGTKGFLRNDQFAVALALFADGDLQLAVLACPALPLDLDDPLSARGTLFLARRGGGAFAAGADDETFAPVSVADPADAPRRRFVESVESGHGNQALQAEVANAIGISATPLRMDSQAKYGAVARGDAALYLRLPSPATPEYREKIWDHAAGALLVEEAGGRVTDVRGRPLDFVSGAPMQRNRGVVAGAPDAHAAALRALAPHVDSAPS
jgi:3'(2'), 5'-bisphosphate nucleotidase